jgi:CRP/FNR family transcriptional regulator, cyclic AMP receptor protein
VTAAVELARFAPLRRLTPQQRAAVADTAHDVAFAAGATLLAEGRQADGCWLISTGRVALSTEVLGRGAVVLQTLGAGDVLGWSWLVPPQLWHLTATAIEPVTAVECDTVALRALAERDPALGYALALGFFELLLARLQSTRARLLDLYGSPRER